MSDAKRTPITPETGRNYLINHSSGEINEMADVKETVIRRIQLLLQMANRKEDNEAEAESAMALAQKLLAANNLEYAMVMATHVKGGTVAAPEEQREKTKISRSAQYQWQRDLWKALAEANFCWHSIIEVFEGKRGKGRVSKVPVKRHMVIGRVSNVVAVRLMGEYLEDTIERLVVTTAGFSPLTRMSRSACSWKAGCAARLEERITALAEARKGESDAARTETPSATTALVLRDVYQQEYAANYDVKYGAGSYQRQLTASAEWEAGREAREEQERQAQAKAEADWLVYLQNETPAQKKAREREEKQARIRADRARHRMHRRWANESYREASKVDREAYRAGAKAGEGISLNAQISEQRKDRSLDQ
jgi:hypothetical protein